MIHGIEPGKRDADGNIELDSGIVIPGGDKGRKAYRGLVVEIGPECVKVKAGDLVYFAPYTGFSIDEGGLTVFFMHEDDVMAGMVDVPDEDEDEDEDGGTDPTDD